MTQRAQKFSTPNGPVSAFNIFEAVARAYPDKCSLDQLRRVRRYCTPDQEAVACRTYTGTAEEAQERANSTGCAVGYQTTSQTIVEYFSPPVDHATAAPIGFSGKLHANFVQAETLFHPISATDVQKRAFELNLLGFDLAFPNPRCWLPMRGSDILSTPLETIHLILDGRLIAVNDYLNEFGLPATAESDAGKLYFVTHLPSGVMFVESEVRPNFTISGCEAKKEPGLTVELLNLDVAIAPIPHASLFPVKAAIPTPTKQEVVISKSKLEIGAVVWHPTSRRFGRVEAAPSAAEVLVRFMHDETVIDQETAFCPFDISAVAKAKPDFLIATCLAEVTMNASFAQGDYDLAKDFACQIASALNRPDAIEASNRTWPPIALVTNNDAEIARLLFKEYGPHIVYTEGMLRRYNPTLGIWEPFNVIRKLIAKLTNHFTYTYGARSVHEFHCGVKSQSAIEASLFELVRDDDWFIDAAPGIAFTNGFLTLTDDFNPALKKHRPENKAIHSTGVAWEFASECIHFKHFIYTQAGGNVYGDFIMGVTGAALLGRATDLDTALFLLGDGGTGKSTTIDTLKLLFPKDALSSVALQDLSGQRGEYYRAQLTGKLFNAVEELPNNAISDTSTFKALVSGGEMEARHPGGRPFTLRPRAAHIFCLNEMPLVSDTSDGFYRRLALIRYDKKMQASISRRANLELFSQELAGIYKFAVLECGVLLRRRMDSDRFIPDEILQKSKDARGHGESVAAFVTDCVSPKAPTDGSTSSQKGIFECYRAYCRGAGLHPVSYLQFGRRLEHVLKSHTKRRKADGNHWDVQIRMFKYWTVAVDELKFPSDPGRIAWVDE